MTPIEALNELIACKGLKDKGWSMRRSGRHSEAEIQAVEREYAERKYKAWENARTVSAEHEAALDAAPATCGAIDCRACATPFLAFAGRAAAN